MVGNITGNMTGITLQELGVIAKHIYDISGVSLDNSKEYLIKTRLDVLLKEFGCASYSELYYKAKSDKSNAINTKIINAITTQETLFFRDNHPFEILKRKIIPEIINKKAKSTSKTIRIWSAASSTGQEIYSIAITLKELIPDINKYQITLMATDISESVLEVARSGIYNKFEVNRGLPQNMMKYFVQNGDTWQLREDIRKMVTFQKRNLMQPLIGLGKFDVVFCRNVAIYFTLEDRTKLFDRIADVMEPDGILFIGVSEFLTGICARFKAVRFEKSIYYQLETKK